MTQYRLPTGAADAVAMDRASVRTTDRDGHLHVEIANISKAAVNPYIGREIVGWEGLGLDPDKVYKLFRDPDELEQAAPSLSGKPLLLVHRPVKADDHPRTITVGAMGTEPSFEAPFLRDALTIWDKEALDLINSDRQKELSAGYHYTPDMTPGTYEGESYDGVMRDIAFNHVALVERGRAGSECFVGDSAGEVEMAQKPLSRKAALLQGAALAFLHPKIAQDSKIDLAPLFAGVTAKNFGDKKKGIAEGLVKAVSGKLAQDASLDLEAAEKLLDALSDINPVEAQDEPPAPLVPGKVPGREKEACDADIGSKVKELLGGKIDDATMATLDKLLEGIGAAGAEHENSEIAGDGDDDEEAKRKAEEEERAKREKEKDMVTKPAMDAALAANEKKIIARMQDAARAREAVRADVGVLDIALDSAESIYRAALGALGCKTAATLPAEGLADLYAAWPKPSAQRRTPAIAQDSAADADYLAQFPNARRLKA
jgi:hypothetical protein